MCSTVCRRTRATTRFSRKLAYPDTGYGVSISLAVAGDSPNSSLVALYSENFEDYTDRFFAESLVRCSQESDSSGLGPGENSRERGAESVHAFRGHETRL